MSRSTTSIFGTNLYDDYPVVGVNWKQARAFCNWRSAIRVRFPDLEANSSSTTSVCRQRRNGSMRPAAVKIWSLTLGRTPYATNSAGCYLANFKPNEATSFPTAVLSVKATASRPDGFSLYCMSGNVSEWTSTAYEASSYYYVTLITGLPVQCGRNGRRDPQTQDCPWRFMERCGFHAGQHTRFRIPGHGKATSASARCRTSEGT